MDDWESIFTRFLDWVSERERGDAVRLTAVASCRLAISGDGEDDGRRKDGAGKID